MVLALRYRLRAPSSLAEDMGIDWEDELRRMQRDEEMMREAGLAWVGEPKMKGDSADQVGDEDKDDTGEDEGKEADGDE